MNFEFRAAQERFEKEQRERLRKAKADAERKRKVLEDARARQAALEEAQRQRRMEEVARQEEARVREAADLVAGDGIRFAKSFLVVPVPGDGDKILLPPSSFSELMSQNAIDKGPMYFELKLNSHAGAGDASRCDVSTHAGVLEFTAAEGCVGLPRHVLQCLQDPSSHPDHSEQLSSSGVSVRYVRLPKGSYAKLQPLHPAFFRIPNHKAVLETKLRSHATLTVGDVLRISHAGANYDVKVVQLKPGDAVSVIDTDMEVDIEPPSEGPGLVKDHEVIPLELERKLEGTLGERQYHYYRIQIPRNMCSDMLRGKLVLRIQLDVLESLEGNDVDVVSTSHPIVLPSLLFHEWSSHDIGSKVLEVNERGRLNSEDGSTPVDDLQYTVGVYGFQGGSKYSVSASIQEIHDRESVPKSGLMLDRTGHDSDPTKTRCGNCGQHVPAPSFFLHEAYCARNNVKCDFHGCSTVLKRDEMVLHKHCSKCGKGMWQNQLQKHMQVFHTLLECPCGISLEMQQMVKHSAEECPSRMILCRFCGDYVTANGPPSDARDHFSGLTQHESMCGSRTTPCPTCSRIIRMKDMDMHYRALHSSQTSTTSTPPSLPSFSFQEAPLPQSLPFPVLTPSVSSLSPHDPSTHLDSNKSMNVSCPICGTFVHSERDLSTHIDMVH